MRCLITGSEGTLGPKLREELRSRGHEVWGCDLMHSSEENYIRADVSNARQLEDVFFECRPEITYHLAAEFGRANGEQYYEQLWLHNAIGTRNVIDSCILNCSHLVFASSSEAYGTLSDGSDMKEEILETQVPKFHNEYALSKWTNEKQIQIALQRGLKATILRFFNAWGFERYSPYRSVVCLFTYRLLKGLPITVYKDYHRVFMHVNDWAVTVANVADRVQKGFSINGEIYNIGGTEYTSVEELKNKIVIALEGSSSEITYLDKEKANITNKRPNIDRAVMHLGHNPTITLDQGLPEYIDWMKKLYDIA